MNFSKKRKLVSQWKEDLLLLSRISKNELNLVYSNKFYQDWFLFTWYNFAFQDTQILLYSVPEMKKQCQ